MAKTRSLDSDAQRLKQKIREKLASRGEDRKADPALQALRRHLKRAQRKRRRLAVRMQQAAPKKAVTGDQPAPAG